MQVNPWLHAPRLLSSTGSSRSATDFVAARTTLRRCGSLGSGHDADLPQRDQRRARRRRVRRDVRRGRTRPPGRSTRPPPLSGAEDVDRAYRAAERPSRRGATRPRPSASGRCSRSPTRSRRAPRSSSKVECENTGKPIALTETEELPPCVDQLRFFAGAARVLEGRSAGEYLADHTSFVRREPIGVVGQVTPWNYPLMMAIWKIAPALAAGQHRGPQAVGHHAGVLDAARRARAGVPAARRPQRRLR